MRASRGPNSRQSSWKNFEPLGIVQRFVAGNHLLGQRRLRSLSRLGNKLPAEVANGLIPHLAQVMQKGAEKSRHPWARLTRLNIR